jgi:pseudo-rSAM protein
MVNDGDKWLYIEPFVHFTEKDGHVLFYNALNRRFLEFTDNEEIGELTRSLLHDENGYVIPLSGEKIKKPSIGTFISKIERLHMGGLLPFTENGNKPVNILPVPAFRKSLSRYEDYQTPQKIDPKDYLHAVYIHVNSGPTPLTQAFPLGFNQFPFPCNSERFGREMDSALIDKLLRDVSNVAPLAINILGCDPPAYSDWDAMIDRLSKSAFKIILHLTPGQALGARIPKRWTNVTSAIFVTFPLDGIDLESIEIIERNSLKTKKTEYNFIIRGSEDLEQAFSTVARHNLTNWFLKPYLNEDNFSFFRENVFITKEDITGSKPDQKQIFSRTTFNENDFGKFTMMPDGTIFANVNDPSPGNYREMGIISMIESEIHHGQSWRRTRQKVEPCKKCVYNFLCPPVSNYEITAGRYNFCHIHKEQS